MNKRKTFLARISRPDPDGDVHQAANSTPGGPTPGGITPGYTPGGPTPGNSTETPGGPTPGNPGTSTPQDTSIASALVMWKRSSKQAGVEELTILFASPNGLQIWSRSDLADDQDCLGRAGSAGAGLTLEWSGLDLRVKFNNQVFCDKLPALDLAQAKANPRLRKRMRQFNTHQPILLNLRDQLSSPHSVLPYVLSGGPILIGNAFREGHYLTTVGGKGKAGAELCVSPLPASLDRFRWRFLQTQVGQYALLYCPDPSLSVHAGKGFMLSSAGPTENTAAFNTPIVSGDGARFVLRMEMGFLISLKPDGTLCRQTKDPQLTDNLHCQWCLVPPHLLC